MPNELESIGDIRARRLRKAGIILTCVAIVVGLPAAWFGPPIYSRWHQDHLVKKARALLAGGQESAAAGTLRRVLAMNLDNVPASRMMADLADSKGYSEAIGLRKRISSLEPNSFDDAYAWADAALRFGDFDAAAQALAILRRTGPGQARCHEVAGRIAAASNRQEEAAAEFAEALRLDPGNVTIQLESAINIIQDKASPQWEEARKKLESLSENPAVRLLALRALAHAAMKDGHDELGVPIIAKIAADPGASFGDKLSYLGTLRGLRDRLFPSYLLDLEAGARGNPAQAAALLSWINQHGLAILGVEWADTLPPASVSKPPIAGELAESYMMLLDWKKLRAFTATGDWGDSEYIRNAFLARALRETGDKRGSENHWSTAVILATAWTPWLYTLDRIADAWDWQSEREPLLWLIAGKSAKPLWALQILEKRYAERGDSHQLLRVWTRTLEIDPSNVEARNHWALLSLLLGDDKDGATKAAADLAAKNPSEPDVIATDALALHLQKHTDEGLRILRNLKPEQLSKPSAAAVYGILLAAKGSPEAGKYLDIAAAAALPPEEEELVALAKNPVKQPVPHAPTHLVELPSQLPEPGRKTENLVELPSQLPQRPKAAPSPAMVFARPSATPTAK